MSRLHNPRHELFSLHIAEGFSITESYIKAGFSPNGAKQSAYKLNKVAAIISRVRELQKEVNARTEEQVSESVDKQVQTRAGRISKLASELLATDQVIRERAVWPEHQDVPGGKTGRVVTSYQQKGTIKTTDGRVTTITPEYYKTHEVDLKLIERRQSLLDQIATELGQKLDKKQQVPMTVDELKALPAFEEFLKQAFEQATKEGLTDDPEDPKGEPN
jgi:hypothetical protein